MPRYKCIVEYEGSDFCGWQRQADFPSVQSVLEEAIKAFSNEKVSLCTAGRTDAGVHAWGQVCHFDLETDFPEEKVWGAINYHVRPNRVAVTRVEKVDEHFHARFSAKRRYYQYHIMNRRTPLILDEKRAWHVGVPLNEKWMQVAANYLLGKHDFTSFRDGQCQASSPIKTLDLLQIERHDDHIIIHTNAKSFLHHMVRNMAGSLKLVGEGKWKPEEMKHVLEATDRTKAGPTAPAHGLYFMKVDY